MGILKDCMCFSEEVINDQGSMFSTVGKFKNFGSVVFDKWVDLSWYRLITDVDLRFSLCFCHIWLGSGSGLASTGSRPTRGRLLSPEQCAFAIWSEVDLSLSEVHESGSLCASSNSFVLLCLFWCDVHHSIMIASSSFLQVWIGNLWSNAKAVDESLLFFDFLFLIFKICFHLFQLLGQEFILLSNFLSCYSQTFVFFLGIN